MTDNKISKTGYIFIAFYLVNLESV